MASLNLEKIKADLLEKHRMRELLDPGRNKAEEEKSARDLRDVPISKIIGHVNYMEGEILPRLAKRPGGKESADYKFFEDVIFSLMHAVSVYDRFQWLQMKHTQLKVQNQLAIENLTLYESELQKYQALEDIFLTDALNKYAEGVMSRMQDLRGKK